MDFKNIKRDKLIKIVFLVTTLIAIFFNIIILNQKIFTYEKISIIVLSIYGLFLCYGVLYEDKEIVKEVHDLFFYFLLLGVFLFRSKCILKLLYMMYMLTILTRLKFNECLFRSIDGTVSSTTGIIGNFSFNEKTMIMVILSNILIYRLYIK